MQIGKNYLRFKGGSSSKKNKDIEAVESPLDSDDPISEEQPSVDDSITLIQMRLSTNNKSNVDLAWNQQSGRSPDFPCTSTRYPEPAENSTVANKSAEDRGTVRTQHDPRHDHDSSKPP
eukprot:TRINITY_DN1008_c0_g1_i1.p1 TRINITY_DN1008_c0_g1~~TRINITY_DN1008_c0_g1_i1.p1  ORF type:complete len:119 (+),score=6.54 TRINITY_DN1008_c0_g1_i1:185-541(+)